MAAVEAASSLFSVLPSSTSSIYPLRPRNSSSLTFIFSSSAPNISLKYPVHPSPLLFINSTRKLSFQVCSVVQETEVEEKQEKSQLPNQRRKLFILNLPWSLTVADIKNLFGECGTVTDVEIIRQKGGKSRGFAFVTMASGEEAQAVVEKFDSSELSGRIIRVEFAKRFKKPSPPPPVGPPPGETLYKLYVSNLAWKVRSTNLREFFAANFNPVSARVVFDSPSGRSAGYGFASFATREEAEAAISALNGKELLGRPVSLKFSEKNIDESVSKEEATAEGQPEES